MIDGRKVILVYSDVSFSQKNQITEKVSVFARRLAQLSYASSSSSKLALFINFSSRLHRSTESLRQGCVFEGQTPEVFPGILKFYLNLTSNWPKQYSS